MKLKAFLFTIFLILATASSGFSQCNTFSDWTREKDGFRKLCFYPTTLRMVNIAKDESFNTMVQDIDKLRLYISDNPKVPFKKDEVSALRKGIKAENFKDMVQVTQGKRSFYIYIKEKHNKPVGFAGVVYSETSLLLIDLEGYVSPEVINQLIAGKINFGAISKLYDITKPAEDKQNKKK